MAIEIKKTPPKSKTSELLDLLPRIMLYPGEDKATFEGLRQAFMLDLAPSTPYQTAIAENLVSLEWEIIRHRQIRDNLVRLNFRAVACENFVPKIPGGVILQSDFNKEVKALANALMGGASEAKTKALALLKDNGAEVSEMVAIAYARASQSLEPHERKLAELEVRRRRLKEDFERLKTAQKPAIEDAEIVTDT